MTKRTCFFQAKKLLPSTRVEILFDENIAMIEENRATRGSIVGVVTVLSTMLDGHRPPIMVGSDIML